MERPDWELVEDSESLLLSESVIITIIITWSVKPGAAVYLTQTNNLPQLFSVLGFFGLRPTWIVP